ncbi:MAG: DinB family protein [Flavobacteriales bacterium]
MRYSFLTLSLWLVFAINLSSCASADDKPSEEVFIDDMVHVMEHMKVYMLEVYDVPADSNMDFRPSEEVMSFREHAAHVLSNMYMQNECFVKRDTTTTIDWVLEDVAGLMATDDRAKLREKIAGQFDAIVLDLKGIKGKQDWNKTRVLPQFDGKPVKDLMTIVMMMRDHITHHRAQMIVYLRLMGYEPPPYRPF